MDISEYYVNATVSVLSDVYYGHTNNSNTTMGNYISDVPESPALRSFETMYKPIHGYLAASVCVFGVIANILNIIVLTRKNMVSSTNIILTGLAISDGLTMAFYFPWALQMYVIHGTVVSSDRDTEGCAKYQLGYAILSVIVHSISIWLTVTLAVFRYVFIRFPRIGAQYCNVQRAKTAVITVAVVVTIVCIPNSISYELKSDLAIMHGVGNDSNATIWWIDVKNNTITDVVLQKFNFWVQAIFVKLLPCFLLTIFSVLLVRTMQDAEKRRKKMMTKNSVADGETQPIGTSSKRSRRSQRTTRMLLTVVILFLVTETPQGVMSLLNGLIQDFFHHVYIPLGDLLDILALINNGINFVLYCTMSKQFRDTFITVFCRCFPKMVDGRKLQTVTTMVTTRDSEV
ncbi:G-protein coupled receptor [Mactra antiquata]